MPCQKPSLRNAFPRAEVFKLPCCNIRGRGRGRQQYNREECSATGGKRVFLVLFSTYAAPASWAVREPADLPAQHRYFSAGPESVCPSVTERNRTWRHCHSMPFYKNLGRMEIEFPCPAKYAMNMLC